MCKVNQFSTADIALFLHTAQCSAPPQCSSVQVVVSASVAGGHLGPHLDPVAEAGLEDRERPDQDSLEAASLTDKQYSAELDQCQER